MFSDMGNATDILFLLSSERIKLQHEKRSQNKQ